MPAKVTPLHVNGSPKPQGPVDVILLTYNGAKLAACFNRPEREVVYGGKLWALNDQFSQHAKQAVYVEINEAVITEVRGNAQMSLGIAERWERKLIELQAEVAVKQ